METINGMFSGPRIVARDGDRLVVKVVNHVPNNISIHRYELNSQWLDRHTEGGVAFATCQCQDFPMVLFVIQKNTIKKASLESGRSPNWMRPLPHVEFPITDESVIMTIDWPAQAGPEDTLTANRNFRHRH
ncbi:hypothetical protein Peur_002072 [Populus x canadensis]